MMPDAIPKLREPEYPETQDRGHLSPKQKAALCLKQDGKCAGCGIKPRHGFEYDHVIELWEGGTNHPDNWQAFGSRRDCKCHMKKTAAAAKRRAKMRRLKGETGQRARREKRGHGLIKSRGFAKPLIAVSESRDPNAWQKPVSKIRSKGFDKTRSKGFDGKVRVKI